VVCLQGGIRLVHCAIGYPSSDLGALPHKGCPLKTGGCLHIVNTSVRWSPYQHSIPSKTFVLQQLISQYGANYHQRLRHHYESMRISLCASDISYIIRL